ncbi:hypothetical protein FB45DRAFT_1020080 [Roridomyces roridus]|uniref:Uncharacterized protein n=1 Tax=Roridomyces roridus TaxID=1738132 RepID=A0AAD7FX55_9AGAR|nr:hypothetical protein FB45DRAFT_1020080 [Roridomyces roridus]
MILGDDDSGKVSESTPLLGETSGTSVVVTAPVPPPAYAPPASPNHSAIYATDVDVEPIVRNRFWRAFLIALGMWLLASILLGTVLDDVDGIQSLWNRKYPTIPDVKMDCMNSWADQHHQNPIHSAFPYSTDTTFSIPVGPEAFLLFSRGTLSAGTLRVVAAPATSDSSDAVIQIKMHYFVKKIRDQAQVCLIGRKTGEWGVAILTPKLWFSPSRTEHLFFDLVLALPQTNSSVYVNGLVTDLDNFEQVVEAPLQVGHLSIKGTNGGIRTKTLEAQNATLVTTNGEISMDNLISRRTRVVTSNAAILGTVKAVDSVDLHTSNGPIRVDVDLDAGNSTTTKDVTIQTSNGVIQSSVRLNGTNATSSFHVKHITTNGQVVAKIASLPLDAELQVIASTSNSPVVLSLPLTYEGDLRAYGNDGIGVKPVDPLERDPAGKGRTWDLDMGVLRMSLMSGSVSWDRKNMHRGSAVATTENGPATIYFS